LERFHVDMADMTCASHLASSVGSARISGARTSAAGGWNAAGDSDTVTDIAPSTGTAPSDDTCSRDTTNSSSTSCARGDTICPAHCTPDAAAQLQPIPYACGAQRALLPIAVGAINVDALMNINDVRESATILPRPYKLTFDLLTLKMVSESRVTWANCMPISVFLSLSVLELFPMYATDSHTDVRQTDVRQHHRLMPRLV